MSTQEALEAAFQKIVENAEANCEVCLYEKRHPDSRRTGMPPHTCHATIDAAAKGMLAAVGECNGISETCEKCLKRATINRLLKGEGDDDEG